MRYALAVLTHGDPEDTLHRTIRSFDRHVTHPPVRRYMVRDGGPAAAPPMAPYPWTVLTTGRQLGFCTATRMLWRFASEGGEGEFDYVFWLEHDFEFTRTVDVGAMARLLDDDSLAQVALMRQPVNENEQAAGSVVADMRRRGCHVEEFPGWLAHTAFFTTNPSLMRRDFMLDNPWPDYPAECEGRFGIDLVQRGYAFAVMGAGEPWVEHIGVRTGSGY